MLEKNVDEKIKHDIKMYSLSNTYNYDEIKKFYDKIIKKLEEENFEKKDILVCEKKFDGNFFFNKNIIIKKILGMSLSLVYNEKGELINCISRGDGEFGLNLTEKVKKYVKNIIPNVKEKMIIRGEVVISKEEFSNKNLIENYKNSRNIIPGILLSVDKEYDINLNFVAYNLIKDDMKNNQWDNLNYLKKLGFEIDDNPTLMNNFNEIIKYIENLNHDKLKYDIDGVVIKVNSIKVQNLLGFTAK
jgi:DNA ligase (NAD+)